MLRTDQMQAPPRLHSSPGHPTVGNQKPRQGEQLLSSPGLRTCLATGLGWGGVPQGPSCPAVQYVLPPRGGGHSAQGSELGLPCAPGAPWLNRPTAVASERPLLQQGLPSPAWPHLCRSVPMCSGPRARDDGFPPRPRPPTPQSSQVNRVRVPHPFIPSSPQQSLSTRWAPPSPITRSTQHRPWGRGPHLLCPELRGPRSGISALKPGQTELSVTYLELTSAWGRQLTNS